jgi:hypothetical protein
MSTSTLPKSVGPPHFSTQEQTAEPCNSPIYGLSKYFAKNARIFASASAVAFGS